MYLETTHAMGATCPTQPPAPKCGKRQKLVRTTGFKPVGCSTTIWNYKCEDQPCVGSDCNHVPAGWKGVRSYCWDGSVWPYATCTPQLDAACSDRGGYNTGYLGCRF